MIIIVIMTNHDNVFLCNSDSSYPTKHQHSSSLPHMYATPNDVSQMQQRWQSNSTHWSTGIPHHQLKPQLLNPSPSSIGMHPHHLRQRKQSPVSSSWVVEMEQLRIRELNQIQQNRRMQHHQQQLPSQKVSFKNVYTCTYVYTRVCHPSVYLFTHLSICSSVSPCINLSIHLYMYSCTSIYPSVYPCIHLFYLFTFYTCIHLSIHPFIIIIISLLAPPLR